jgi:hypothetical protein
VTGSSPARDLKAALSPIRLVLRARGPCAPAVPWNAGGGNRHRRIPTDACMMRSLLLVAQPAAFIARLCSPVPTLHRGGVRRRAREEREARGRCTRYSHGSRARHTSTVDTVERCVVTSVWPTLHLTSSRSGGSLLWDRRRPSWEMATPAGAPLGHARRRGELADTGPHARVISPI